MGKDRGIGVIIQQIMEQKPFVQLLLAVISAMSFPFRVPSFLDIDAPDLSFFYINIYHIEGGVYCAMLNQALNRY